VNAAHQDRFIEVGGERLCNQLVKQRIIERAPLLREIGFQLFASRQLRNFINAAPTRRSRKKGCT
jgi:hypothetical protein